MAGELHTGSDPVAERLVAFARALRTHSVSVGTSEIVDAAAAARVLGYADRSRLREALAATMLRRAGQRQLFDELFDLYYPAALGARSGVAQTDPLPPEPAARRALAAALRSELAAALASTTSAEGDPRRLTELAARVVEQLGALPNDATLGAFSARQALDLLAPQTAIAAALAARLGAAATPGATARPGGPGQLPGGGAGTGGGLGERLAREELRTEVAAFRRRVESETRRRNAEVRGTERVARYAVSSPLEQTSFVLAGPDEVAELRRAIVPLARKLATRLAAKRRRGRSGPIDIRRTLRRAMATGGVPMHPAYRPRTRARTDLVLLTDMSSSVAGFSRFTILLMQALAGEFRRVRIFGFVNVVDELTELVRSAPPGADLAAELDDLSRMTRWHTNSDYGSAFADFVDHHLDAIGPRSVVLVLGDARTNHTDPGLAALRAITGRARAAFFLNPEPASQWSSGDSVAAAYAEVIEMHECRNLAQLRQFITRLLPV